MKRKTMKLLLLCLVTSLVLLISGQAVFAGSLTFYNQDITAYVSASGSHFASSHTPYQGGCAMHPYYKGDHSSRPIAPFGATVMLSDSVPMYNTNGQSWDTFTVEDIGDVDENQGLTYGWIDIWQAYGTYGSTPYNWCINTFGTLTRGWYAWW